MMPIGPSIQMIDGPHLVYVYILVPILFHDIQRSNILSLGSVQKLSKEA